MGSASGVLIARGGHPEVLGIVARVGMADHRANKAGATRS
jgi:hypothetical protein